MSCGTRTNSQLIHYKHWPTTFVTRKIFSSFCSFLQAAIIDLSLKDILMFLQLRKVHAIRVYRYAPPLSLSLSSYEVIHEKFSSTYTIWTNEIPNQTISWFWQCHLHTMHIWLHSERDFIWNQRRQTTIRWQVGQLDVLNEAVASWVVVHLLDPFRPWKKTSRKSCSTVELIHLCHRGVSHVLELDCCQCLLFAVS